MREEYTLDWYNLKYFLFHYNNVVIGGIGEFGGATSIMDRVCNEQLNTTIETSFWLEEAMQFIIADFQDNFFSELS